MLSPNPSQALRDRWHTYVLIENQGTGHLQNLIAIAAPVKGLKKGQIDEANAPKQQQCYSRGLMCGALGRGQDGNWEWLVIEMMHV
ncbi:MAG TPA: hypothetical protein VEZ50_16100, partial [Nodosilinea sp.]|nr:hypothetical protein [Nodosilinea sp.]